MYDLMYTLEIVGVIVFSVLFVLAFLTLRVVTVQEATAVAFKYLGRFVYCAMELAGHSFDLDGSIVPRLGPNGYGSCWCIWRFGGWVFYLRPFVTPAKYSDYNDPDNFGDGVYVRLGDRTSEPYTAVAETADPENVGLNVKFVSTMRVVHPYRYLFVSPADVMNQVVKRQNSVLRAWVRSGDQNHAQIVGGDSVRPWSELVDLGWKSVFEEIETDWGLRILENSIIVKEVGFDSEYQAALKAQSQAALQAKASVEETAGRILRSVAQMSGVDVDNPVELNEFMKKLKDDPSLRGKSASEGGYREAFDYAQDQVKRDRAGAAGDLRDIRVGSSDGTPFGKGTIAEIIGGVAAAFAAKDASRGGGQGNRGGKGPGGGSGGIRPSDKSDREIAEETHGHTGEWPSWWDPATKQRK